MIALLWTSSGWGAAIGSLRPPWDASAAIVAHGRSIGYAERGRLHASLRARLLVARSPPLSAPAPAWRYTALALLFTFFWSAAFVAVKIGLRDSPPFFLMALRFYIAGGLLLAWAHLRGRALPRTPAEWRSIALLGLLNYALYLGLTAVALQHLSAGMGAVLASTNPLMLALVAPWVLGERLTVKKGLGMLTSFGGVVWVMSGRLGDDNRLSAIGLVLLSIASLVAGTIAFKRVVESRDLLVLNAGQLLAAGVFLTVPCLLWEPIGSVRFSASFLIVQAFLVVGVSWIGMSSWFWLLSHGDATRASAWFFLNPVLGLFLGALVIGEPLRALDFAGGLAVALGIYVVQRS
jgi:drug/metabolite transporter (DMT)-like permease